jgi:hypothetical protein
MAKKGDQFRIIRDVSGRGALNSPILLEAAAAFAYGFPFYGDTGASGEQKAFVDETEVVGGKPVRRVSFAFDALRRCPLEPMAGPETVTLATIWERLVDHQFAVANPGHPVAHLYATLVHLFQLRRKLIAGLQDPRPPTIAPDRLDLAPIDTFEGDPQFCAVEPAVCPEPDQRFTFRPVRDDAIDVKTFFERWESEDWVRDNPDHPTAWVRRTISRVPLPRVTPLPGFPVGVPMERHQLIRQGKRRLWLPWFLSPEKKRELIRWAKLK